jgi:D-methionine transport system substrate-binding protein
MPFLACADATSALRPTIQRKETITIMNKNRRTIVTALAITLGLALSACSSGGGSNSTTSAPPATTQEAPATTDQAAEAAPSTTEAEAPAASEPPAAFTAPGEDEKGGKNKPIKIGVVGASGPQFQTLKANAEAEGIFLEFVDFTDYQQPNPATSTGELDLNQFQHIIFLASYNNETGSDLVPIGSTAIYPLGLYSNQYTSVDEIPEGSQIAIPNDETNQARALQVLASAGLITLKDGTPSLYATPDHVDTAASKVKVTPVAANLTGRSVEDPSVAGAVVNNDYVSDSGLDPLKAIAQDDPASDASLPFVNIWVTRAADQDLPVYQEVVRLAAQDDFGQDLKDNSGGTGVVINLPATKLQEVLADVQQQQKDNAG